MLVRPYREGEHETLWSLFFNTIHSVNSMHYSAAQIEAWAPSNLDMEIWKRKIDSIKPHVVEKGNEVIAYGDIQKNGYIDHFFCDCRNQRQGVGSLLFSYLLKKSAEIGVSELFSDVSVTAKPFFISKGFIVQKKQKLAIRGQELENYRMVRHSVAS